MQLVENENYSDLKHKIVNHSIYQYLESPKALNLFLEHHIFCVWDFMSIVKSIQHDVVPAQVPWKPSSSDERFQRIINEIVLAEESDLDINGNPKSHFLMYIDAMLESNASTDQIGYFVETLDFNQLSKATREFVSYSLEIANSGCLVSKMSSFFYGREDLIPPMFTSLVRSAKILNERPKLKYYLDRHIELDAGQHGPKLEQCLNLIVKTDEDKRKLIDVSQKSLKFRLNLLDEIESKVKRTLS